MATKKDQKAQSKRFVEKAKELGADESGEAFERVFSKVVRPRKPTKPEPLQESPQLDRKPGG